MAKACIRLLGLCCSTPLAENQYTYSQLTKITNKFERVLSTGESGVIYHGVLNDQQVVVKMLYRESFYNIQQFTTQVHNLLRIRHKNLVSLIGYCNEEIYLALIYDFVANGDLKDHLSGKFSNVLSWESRLKISIEVAEGLEHLHSWCGLSFIHGRVMPKNILLDGKYEVKLAGFGLSRSYSPAESTNTFSYGPTWGYMDPEYYRASLVSPKNDIYSLAIVLLEMITNQPVVDNKREKAHISNWVADGGPQEIVDPGLNNDFDANSVSKALEVALACAAPARNRPSMSQVVIELNECLTLEMTQTRGTTGETTHETQ